ncbi:hypothetical protein BKA66DRAFT_469322 [Pyrenochaeta sp. MPI-SDFR-AT-0127]|nr:hypothetical protein BKA66DRAFT_469322 [Pyrenochaeta sp. MPI-SDFR-AT-0127]
MAQPRPYFDSDLKLLDMTPEIFAHIIHLLVEDVGVFNAFQYRPVCKTFAAEIFYNVISLRPAESFRVPEGISMVQHRSRRDLSKRFLEAHSYSFLRARVEAANGFHSHLITLARDVADALLRYEGSHSNSLRSRYRDDICKSFLANSQDTCLYDRLLLDKRSGFKTDLRYADMMPNVQEFLLTATAAAVGSQKTLDFFSTVGCPRYTYMYPYSNLLCAAVGSGKICTTRSLLELIRDALKRMTGLFPFTRAQWIEIGRVQWFQPWHFQDAISITIREGFTEIGQLLYEFLAEHPEANSRTHDIRSATMIECLERDNVDLIYPALRCLHNGALKFANEDLRYLFNRGNGKVLHRLIHDGLVNAHRSNSTTPLKVVLDNKKYCHAKVLLDFGVDIDGTPYANGGVSVLWHAVQSGNTEHVKFLLDHGANPESHEGWRSPLKEAKKRGRKNIIELLQNATKK